MEENEDLAQYSLDNDKILLRVSLELTFYIVILVRGKCRIQKKIITSLLLFIIRPVECSCDLYL